jgi:activator of 2-hydroxyglutaryl-CoA dehydratase
MAHNKAAEEFLPRGHYPGHRGQDIKHEDPDGAIYNIMLNEACSSGCGSFIDTIPNR